MTEYLGIIITLLLVLLGLLVSLLKVELLVRSQIQRIKHVYKTKRADRKADERWVNYYKKSRRARRLRYLYLKYLR